MSASIKTWSTPNLYVPDVGFAELEAFWKRQMEHDEAIRGERQKRGPYQTNPKNANGFLTQAEVAMTRKAVDRFL
jgi:hypothetical protein